MQRVMLGKVAPEVREALGAMNKLVEERGTAAGIPDAFSHLLRLRASQINGCAFCVRLHARDAAKAGEAADRIALVAAWRESVYQEAVEVLSEEEITAVEWLAVVINVWNRMSIASRPRVTP